MIQTPPGLELRGYQVEGARHLVGSQYALLGDDPGLGKTIQVAAALNCALPGIKVFVGCPETLMINWMKELRKWLVRPLSIGLASSKRVPATDIVIANYDIFPKLQPWFRQTPFSIAVLDEAHRIKTPDTQRTQAAGHIVAAHRWALTGTPILNRPIEAWSLLWWLMRERVMDYGRYATSYCDAHLRTIWVKRRNKRTGQLEPKQQKKWYLGGASHLDELHAYLVNEARMLRRRKEDVLTELPAKVRQVIELSGAKASRILNAERSTAQSMGGYDEAIRRMQDGEAVSFEEFTKVRHELALAKVGPSIDYIEDALAEEAKVVVFCHHRDVLAALAEGLKAHNPVAVWGGMTAGAKDDAVTAFQTDPNVRVFLGNDAACEGLTLTAAQRCIFVELDPVPGRMIQFEDRLHRFGQKGAVLVQALVFAESLDVRLIKLLWSKSKIISRAVDGTD